MDDGKFFIRTFGREQRDIDSIESNEFDVNKAIKLPDHTMPNDMFSDPFITSEFLTGDDLFVSLFDNKQLVHYHFVYDIQKRTISSKVVTH